MRMQHLSAWVGALLLNAACVVAAQAQDASYGAPSGGIIQVSATDPIQAVNPGGVPMGMPNYPGYSTDYGAYPTMPWPETSPFDYSIDQTYIENGLWYNRKNKRQQRAYIGVDFFNAVMKRPTSGQPGGLIGTQTGVNSVLGGVDDDDADDDAAPQNPSVYDFTARGLVGQVVHIPQKDDIIAPHYTEEFGADNAHNALRLRTFFVNPDDSGFELTGFYVAGDRQVVTAEQGSIDRKRDQFASAGEGPHESFGGGVFFAQTPFIDAGRLVYDQGFEMDFDSQAWGSEVNFLTSSISSSQGLGDFHGLFGVRYLGIWEEFGITAWDSGFSEIVINPDGRTYQVSPFTTTIDSGLTSHLIGPQIGLRWEIGGENLKLTTEVKGSIAANLERRRLNADGYGLDINSDEGGFVTTTATFIEPADPRSTSLEENNVTVSPILGVEFMAQMPVMKWIPVVNTLPLAREAQFRIGWSYTQAWRVNRAAQSIEYNAPLPRLTTDRDSWHVQGLTAGFDWVY